VLFQAQFDTYIIKKFTTKTLASPLLFAEICEGAITDVEVLAKAIVAIRKLLSSLCQPEVSLQGQ
jgi:hypothetical protein